jgi:hypothetical protein
LEIKCSGRKIFGPKGDELSGQLRISLEEELCNLFMQVTIVKSKKLLWNEYFARIEHARNSYRILNILRNEGGDGKIILGGIFEKYVVTVASGWTWLRIVEFEASNLRFLLSESNLIMKTITLIHWLPRKLIWPCKRALFRY